MQTPIVRMLVAYFLTAAGLAFGAAPSRPSQLPDPVQIGVPAMQVYGEREGLPHPTLHSLALDAEGRIWAGTQDGAAWFNGRNWTTVEFPRECKSRFIRALALTPDGSGWFGTQDDGLWQHRGESWIHHDAARGLAARRINHLQWVPEGTGYVLWAATSDVGVARYAKGTWKTWGRAEGLRDPWVWRVRPARGGVWVVGLGGLASVKGERLEPNPLGTTWKEPCNEILDLRGPDGIGDILLSCWDKGLVRREGSHWRLLGREEGFPSRNPVALATTTDPDGTRVLWAGTYDVGLAWKRGNGPWVTLDPARGFPTSGVYDLLADSRHKPALWVAMRQAGLGALDPGGWIQIDTRKGGPLNRIQAMAHAGPPGKEIAWFGSEQGVLHWEGGAWVHDAPGKGFPTTLVNTLLESRAFGEPCLVAGTIKGLAVKEPGGWTLVKETGPFRGLQVMTLLEREEDGAPALWVGREGGLARFQRGQWTNYTTRNGLPNGWIYALAAGLDHSGQQTLWVGTRGGGVARFQEGVWTSYGLERGLPHPSVYGLLLEPLPAGGQRLWAATYGGGIAWIDPDDPTARWSHFSTATHPALPTDAILRLERDGVGRIYATTTRGVVRLEGAPGTAPGPAWSLVTFTEGDGLPSRLCNQGASFLDREGRLWVGTASGLAVLDPKLATTSTLPTLPNLDRILIGGQPQALNGSLDLRHDQGTLAFEFSLPTFHRNEDLRYQTQVLGLEGAPGPWTPDAKRELAGLGPGRYTLRIRARDHLGRETQARDLVFRIRPTPWRTPAAYALYALALLALGWGAHRLRVGLLEARNRVLRARIKEATSGLAQQKDELEVANQNLKGLDETKSRMLGIVAHDLRNPLSAIMMSAEFLSEPDVDSKETVEVAGKILQAAHFMHELLRRFLDLEAIERGKLDYDIRPVDPIPVVEALFEVQSFKARAKGLELVLEIPLDVPPLMADKVFLQEVLENLVSNAIKFTPKGPPVRRITVAAGPGWLEVRDQGPGLSPEDQAKAFGQFVRLSARPTGGESSTGLGLAIVKALVVGMGGEITLESEQGRGSTFRVEFRVAVGDGVYL